MNWLQIEQVIACLRSYRQYDEDGVMVIVSRQACHEAAEALMQLNQENSDLRAQCGGMQMEIQELKACESAQLCPHGFVLSDNICGPCSEGRPNKTTPAQRDSAK